MQSLAEQSLIGLVEPGPIPDEQQAVDLVGMLVHVVDGVSDAVEVLGILEEDERLHSAGERRCGEVVDEVVGSCHDERAGERGSVLAAALTNPGVDAVIT